MNRLTGRAAVGAGAAAGLLLTASAALPRMFLRIVTDRDEPPLCKTIRSGITKRLCNAQTCTDIIKAGAELAAADTETIRTTATDGTALVGHLYRCEKPKRILIAMHGWRSSWSRDFGVAAQFWHDSGCTVLFAEQRGQGSSGGNYLSFGMMERYDCLSWANYIARNESSTLPVYLVGISMGATAVLLASALPLPQNVRGIIADCGFSSPEAIWRHVTEQKLHIPYALLRRYTDRTCKSRFGCLPAEATTAAALSRCKVPVLLIHGRDDAFVPYEMSVEAKNACACSCSLLSVDGAGHGESFLRAPELYRQTMRRFWAENDGT